MIFKSRRAMEEEIGRRVIEAEERNRNDRRMYELEDKTRKLEWRVAALEGRLNPSAKTHVVLQEEDPVRLTGQP